MARQFNLILRGGLRAGGPVGPGFGAGTGTIRLLLVAACWQSVSVAVQAQAEPRSTPRDVRLITTQIPIEAAVDRVARKKLPDRNDPIPLGSRIVAFDPSNPDAGVVVLTDGFAAAARPDLSFDARRILFVGNRRPEDPPAVWEMKIDGTERRRITNLPAACTDALYISTMYTMDVERPYYQIAFRAESHGSHTGSLYTCRMDGSGVRRITFSPLDVVDPLILSDGRLLFGLGSPPDSATSASSGGVKGVSLYTVHADGTDLFPFAGLHEPQGNRTMPCELADGSIVYVESPPGIRGRGGALVSVGRTRSLHSRRVIAEAEDGPYHCPAPWPDGNLLVSYRDNGEDSYGLYVLDPRTGTRTAALLDDPQWHELDALAIAPRRRPAGRSSVVNKDRDVGQLFCLDAYMSDTVAGKGITRGRIARLRVIASLETPRGAAPAKSEGGRVSSSNHREVAEVVLGEVPVEADGSFFLEVPARTPLRLETIDPVGDILQRMRSWFWVMPGERRGCIGCHEDRELTPPNRHVLALRKGPRSLTGSAPAAATPTEPKRDERDY